MTESKPLNTLAAMLSHLLPDSVRQAMRKHDDNGGSCKVDLPPTGQAETILTQVRFEPGSTVALFKLGEDPAQVVWGEQIPDAEAFLACVRINGELQAHLYDLEGNSQQLDRAPGAEPYDFGDLPVTELVEAAGSRSNGKSVRERVSAAQRELLGDFQAHVGSGRRSNRVEQ